MDEVGGWCQVPGLIAHTLDPSPTDNLPHSRIKAMMHSKPAPGASPVRNPHYYPALVKKFMDAELQVDNSVSLELVESFTLAASQQQTTYDEANSASDMEGLMQLLSCTDMNLY